MAWKEIPGLKGRVYVPEEEPKTPKKHGCKECFSCQMCSDDRCRLCGECSETQGAKLQGKICNASGKNPCGRRDQNGFD